MSALSPDALPFLPAPRLYFPACEPLPLPVEPLEIDEPDDLQPAMNLEGAPGGAAASPGFLDRLLATAAQARAAMAWARAERLASLGVELAAAPAAASQRARFAAELSALALLRGGGEDPRAGGGDAEGGDAIPAWQARLNAALGHGAGGDAAGCLARLDALRGELQAGDARAALLLALNTAAALLETGDASGATDAAVVALRDARRERLEQGTAQAQLVFAAAELVRGRRNVARVALGEAVRSFARLGDSLRQIQCHYLLGEVAWLGEDPIRSGSHYRDGLGIAREAGAKEWIELLTLRFEHR